MPKAIIAGASGLIGGQLLQTFLDQPGYDEVLILVRKVLPVKHKKLRQLVVDYTKLNDYAEQIKGDALFSCLGTTKQQTPDEKEYYTIDHDYPVTLAKIALRNNIPQYHLVSSAGADAKASLFYPRLKGETEDDIIKVGLPRLHIYRPMMLMGERKGKRSIGEGIATALFKVIDPLLIGGLKKYRSIAGATVAKAMYIESLKKQTGIFIHASEQIQATADQG